MRFSRARGPRGIGWDGHGGVMGRGCLVWRQMVWEGCPQEPASSLGRADGVWGGSWWLPGRGGSSRRDAGSLLGAICSDQGGKVKLWVRGMRDFPCLGWGAEFNPLCFVP